MTPEFGAMAVGFLVVALARGCGALFHAGVIRRASRHLAARANGSGSPPPVRRLSVERLDALCSSAGVRVHAAVLGRWWLRVGTALIVVGIAIGGPGLGLLLGILAATAPVLILRMLAGRADAGYDSSLAAALDSAARSVRSGASLQAAIAEAAGSVGGPVSADLHRVASATQRGASLVEALGQWVERRARRSVRLAAGAIALAVESGGAPGRVLDDVATALRQRHQTEREAHALAAQARLSAVVVGVAPIAFTVVACMADPRHARVLFATPLGLSCLAAGMALDAVGATWMHRISRSVTPW